MIFTQNLCKKYGRFTAVQQLNLNVHKGTVLGLVGENGAGKTTTLSMLATLSTPTSGKAYINGFEVTKEPAEVRRSIGFMPDSFGVYDDLTVEEYLRFYADCYHVPDGLIRCRQDDLLARVNLIEKRQTYVNALSRGMQQRLEIARCLMHDPEVLILDEPSAGLDPRSRIELRNVLHQLRNLGKTILVSSHILHELAEFADEIGILRRGELATVAAVGVMLSHTAAYRSLWLTGNVVPAKWDRIFRDDKHVIDISYEQGGVSVLYAGTTEQQSELLRSCIEAGLQLSQFTERPTDIESLFLRLTESEVHS